MANKSKRWTAEDYKTQAEEFVSCYGKGYCRDEFVSEYCQLFEGRLPFDAFDGKAPFSEDSLQRIAELRRFYALDLDSRASHRLIEADSASSRGKPTTPKSKAKKGRRS